MIGLKREDYKIIMQCLSAYYSAIRVLYEDISLSYSMLVYCIESLSSNYDKYIPTWDDYDYDIKMKLEKISTCAVRFYSHTTKLGTQIQWICSFLGHYKRNLSLSEPDILIVILIDHFDSSKGTASML